MAWSPIELTIAVALFAGLLLVVELGRRAGARGERAGEDSGQLGALQAAVLGLLGLLLGFSFSGAASRFIERQDLVTLEANAIGTAALRAELLDEPHRSALRGALRSYAAFRLEHFEPPPREHARLAAEASRLHASLWKAASEGVAAKPALALAVLAPVNDVIDLYTTREVAAARHLPMPVFALLLACSIVGVALVGYGAGLAGGRQPMLTAALAFLVAAALWTTLDLDYPRRGLIRMSDAPLRGLSFE